MAALTFFEPVERVDGVREVFKRQVDLSLFLRQIRLLEGHIVVVIVIVVAVHVVAVPIVVLMTLVVDGRVFDPVVVDGVGHRHGPVAGVGGRRWCGTKGSGGGDDGPCSTIRSVFEIRLGGRARANWRGIVYARNGRISRLRVHGVYCCGRSREITVNYRLSRVYGIRKRATRKLCAYDDEQITKDEILRTGQFVGNLFVASRITKTGLADCSVPTGRAVVTCRRRRRLLYYVLSVI